MTKSKKTSSTRNTEAMLDRMIALAWSYVREGVVNGATAEERKEALDLYDRMGHRIVTGDPG